MKKNLKPYAYKQSEHYSKCDGVPFVEWASELLTASEVKFKKDGAAAKASLKRADSLLL